MAVEFGNFFAVGRPQSQAWFGIILGRHVLYTIYFMMAIIAKLNSIAYGYRTWELLPPDFICFSKNSRAYLSISGTTEPNILIGMFVLILHFLCWIQIW